MPIGLEHINVNLQKAKYAVRGEVPALAAAIDEELKDKEKAKKYDFDKVIFCNIGNPQKLGQKPLNFCREVVSLVLDPTLIKSHSEFFNKESIERAENILRSDKYISSYGYTHIQGSEYIRKQVARFIEKRDGLKNGSVKSEDIFLTDGASTSIKLVLAVLNDMENPENVGYMIPVPQYPLYSAAITCLGGNIVPYYLNEETSWSLDMNDVRKNYEEQTSKGIDIRAIIVINPGNPTGSVLDEDCMMELMKFISEKGIVLLADEVYQVNIYDKRKEFKSFRYIADKFKSLYPNSPSPRLVSFHSSSKGVFGECGQRGGYLSFSGFGELSDKFRNLLKCFAGPSICPNIIGQCVVSTMVAPPNSNTETGRLDAEQKKDIYDSLKRRAEMASSVFNNKGLKIESQSVEGALYAFPKLLLPQKFIDEARKNSEEPDAAYCKRLVRETGLVVVPGSGFLQKKGTYHFRTSILPQEEDYKKFLDTFIEFHKKILDEYEN